MICRHRCILYQSKNPSFIIGLHELNKHASKWSSSCSGERHLTRIQSLSILGQQSLGEEAVENGSFSPKVSHTSRTIMSREKIKVPSDSADQIYLGAYLKNIKVFYKKWHVLYRFHFKQKITLGNKFLLFRKLF